MHIMMADTSSCLLCGRSTASSAPHVYTCERYDESV